MKNDVPSRTVQALLALLATFTLLGLLPWPELPTLWPEGLRPHQVRRVQVAALLGGSAVGLALGGLRRGQRGLAFEWLALAMPFLAIRSKWAALLGAAALAALALEAMLSGSLDGSPPPPVRMRLLAGAAVATCAWLLLLGGEGLLRHAPRDASGLACFLWVAESSWLGLIGVVGLFGALYQGLRALAECPGRPTREEATSLGLLGAAFLLPLLP